MEAPLERPSIFGTRTATNVIGNAEDFEEQHAQSHHQVGVPFQDLPFNLNRSPPLVSRLGGTMQKGRSQRQRNAQMSASAHANSVMVQEGVRRPHMGRENEQME